MKTAILGALFIGLGATSAWAASNAPVVNIYKSPTCGCCTKWDEYMTKNGFRVEAKNVADVSAYRSRNGMPARLASCHNATVGGYAIEGHVPAREIKRLLSEHPKVKGLAVPAMVPGSPGMEGARSFPYQVLLVQNDGSTSVYASYP